MCLHTHFIVEALRNSNVNSSLGIMTKTDQANAFLVSGHICQNAQANQIWSIDIKPVSNLKIEKSKN